MKRKLAVILSCLVTGLIAFACQLTPVQFPTAIPTATPAVNVRTFTLDWNDTYPQTLFTVPAGCAITQVTQSIMTQWLQSGMEGDIAINLEVDGFSLLGFSPDNDPDNDMPFDPTNPSQGEGGLNVISHWLDATYIIGDSATPYSLVADLEGTDITQGSSKVRFFYSC